jgi:tellurite resistance protein
MIERGDSGAVALIAPYLFAGANITFGLIALGTLRLIVQGHLLPQAATAPREEAAAGFKA